MTHKATKIADELKAQYPEFSEDQIRYAAEEVLRHLKVTPGNPTPEGERTKALIKDIVKENDRLRGR